MADRKSKSSRPGRASSRAETRGASSRKRSEDTNDQRAHTSPSAPKRREYRGPSSEPVKEGLEGAVFENDEGTDE